MFAAINWSACCRLVDQQNFAAWMPGFDFSRRTCSFELPSEENIDIESIFHTTSISFHSPAQSIAYKMAFAWKASGITYDLFQPDTTEN